MNLSAIFIKRPIATALFAVAILLSGTLAYFHLPVAPLPNVVAPVVVVSAGMAGASPDIMAATVAEPLEKRMGIIAGVTELTSQSYVGATRIVALFDASRNIDSASRDVQAAIQAARADLPTTLRSNPAWRQFNPADSPIMILALTSDTLTMAQLYDSADTVVQQQLSQVAGVGQVTLGGGALPSVRVELQPDQLNSYGIGMEDVRAAIAAANANSAKGYLDQGNTRFEVLSNDQASVAADYKDVIIAYRNNTPVLLRDIADVSDGSENIRNIGLFNNKPAVGVIVFPVPGANIVATDAEIRKRLPSIEASLPSAVHVSIAQDRSQSVSAAVDDTERTLVIAVLLVVGVVFIFLQSLRATWIPAVALPLSIIGTFGPMYLLGFSIDNLSLMALTIGTGFVVDDAVVVLENIARHIEDGMAPYDAAIQGSKEVSFTIVSMSVSLIAVFIPILLMQGQVGLVFHEFAVVLSVAILISMVVSLTITPCMCAHMLTSETLKRKAPWAVWTERQFDRFKNAYARALDVVLGHTLIVVLVLLVLIVGNYFSAKLLSMTLVPEQDTGLITGSIIADQDISFPEMAKKLSQLEGVLQKDPGVLSIFGAAGSGSAGRAGNTANVYIQLKPLNERKLSATDIVARLRPKLNAISGAKLFLAAQQDLHFGGRQSASEYQYTLRGDDADSIYNLVPQLVDELSKHPEALTDVNTDVEQNGLQTYVTIDRHTAERYGFLPNQVDQVLYDAFGQRSVSTIYNPFNQYFVIMEVAPKYWQYPTELNRIFLSTAAGDAQGTAQTQMPGGTVSGLIRYTPVVATATGTSSTNSLNSNAEANAQTNAISNGRGGTSSGSADSTAAETMVPVTALASVVNSHTAIQVNHQNGQVAGTISFNLPSGGSLSKATAAIDAAMVKLKAPATVHGSPQGSAQVFAQSLGTLPMLIIVALVTIYIVLGILYENTMHPITILSTLPSAGIGAILALLIFGIPFSLIAFIGVILLIGIVKKNGIMMVDVAIHLERNENLEPREAIYQACLIRLRPIMMTTMAAVLGAVPLAIGIGQGASLRQPLGITVMGGLILSQIFTLFTTPVIYLLLERLRIWLVKVSSKMSWNHTEEIKGTSP